MNLSQQTYT